MDSGFRKGRGTRDHAANIHWIIEKARVFLELTVNDAGFVISEGEDLALGPDTRLHHSRASV